MNRKWHVEHSDGSWWTREQLKDLANLMRIKAGEYPWDQRCLEVCVDRQGRPWLIGECSSHLLVDEDVVVVWDD